MVPATVTDVIFDPAGGQQAEMVLAVRPPSGATDLQVSPDPRFLDAVWVPVRSELRVTVDHTGYQMLHVRFRLEDGTVTAPNVVGSMVDPTIAAATASVDGLHQPSWIGPLSPTELVVRVESGRVSAGSLVAYDLDDPPDGDRLTWGLFGPKIITRDGEPYAFPVSERTDVVRLVDELIGRPLDAEAVASEDWSITVGDQAPSAPVAVTVVSRPTGGGVDGDGDPFSTAVNDFVLTLAEPIAPGLTYRIDPPDGSIASAEFTFDPTKTRSPAVRVNQVGYGADDGLKLAYLAGWFDGIGAGAATSAERFLVVDEDGVVVFEGSIVPRPFGRDLLREDLTGTEVSELDFSAVTTPGRYRVCVVSVGCSYEFSITDNPWRALTAAVARSAYHQRSGVALGPPYTSFHRPRPYHPDEGLVVEASDYSLLDGNREPELRFGALVDRATGVEVTDAWGGHFDAGDWDRRIQHLWYVRNAAQLVMSFPAEYEPDLNIPESGDTIPDVLDEGLWSLDFYRRLQGPNGAIRGGIEASEHPPANSASWVDDLAVYAFAPDPWSSYVYAGVAAEVSAALQPYDTARAAEYLESALAAAAWADGQVRTEANDAMVTGQQNVAAAALLLATGDPKWHSVFVETADYLTVGFGDDAMLCHAHTRCDGGWLYLQADESLTDPTIRRTIIDRFVSSAEATLVEAEATAYRWTTEDGNVPLVWGLGPGGAPRTSGLLRAYMLSGDQRFRDAAVASAGYSLGANPLNTTFVTGFGQEQPRHPLIVDSLHGGIPVWPGTPVYGHHQLNSLGNDQWAIDVVLNPGGANPSPDAVPFLWQWYDVPTIAFFNEYTMHQSHADALFGFGVLAATG